MKDKEVKLNLSRNEVEDLLEVYRSMDAIVTDFREIFDTSINKIPAFLRQRKRQCH